jgi:hypothetical protein
VAAEGGHETISLFSKVPRQCSHVLVQLMHTIRVNFPYMAFETASVVQWSEFLATQRRCIVFPVRYELNFLYVM